MSPNMSSVSKSIRVAKWRQGSFVRRDDAKALLKKSIDQVIPSEQSKIRLVVVTQDCDLVQGPDIEPFVEFISGCEIAKGGSLFQNGRNPRRLHIQSIGPQEIKQWLEISIHDRFRVQKEGLANLAVDETTRLTIDDAELLRRWIARRYTRPAFPDEFNLRLKRVDEKLENLFKSEAGKLLTGIFLDVIDDEIPQGEQYNIEVRITTKAEIWEDDQQYKILDEFEEQFLSIFDNCKGISVSDIQTLPEEDITLADLRQFKQLEKDYRSFPKQKGVERPVDY